MNEYVDVLQDIHHHADKTKAALEIALQTWHNKDLPVSEAHSLCLSSYNACTESVNAIYTLIDIHKDMRPSILKVARRDQTRALHALCLCSAYCNALTNNWAAMLDENKNPKTIAMFGQFVLHSVAQGNLHLATMNAIPSSTTYFSTREEETL